MSGIETATFGVLWIVVVSLGMLVVLLYRQLERAYESATNGAESALSPGVEAPELEVVERESLVPFDFPAPDQLGLIAFITVECDSCLSLLKALAKVESRVRGGVTVLVNGEDDGRLRRYASERTRLRWLAHPPDAIFRYGVNRVPLVYALEGRKVLAAKHATSIADLEDLLEDAERFSAIADHNASPATTVAAVSD